VPAAAVIHFHVAHPRLPQVTPDRADKFAMDILSIAQQGLSRAQGELEKSAQRIAGAALPQSQPPEDSLNLSDQMVSLLQAKTDFEASVKLAHVGAELSGKTLNLLA
jgi:hypothetical protein